MYTEKKSGGNMLNRVKRNRIVLVGVLKSKRDLRLLLREQWYRIPVAFFPKRAFTHIAFYQPAVFGGRGKRIEFFARVAGKETRRRIELLPRESEHPRAQDEYVKVIVRRVKKLAKPIKNIIPRRVSFGFTTLRALQSARDILELYGVPKTEQILAKRLARNGIQMDAERTISARGDRCRIDLAVSCACGALAIECDNDKAHASAAQKQRDEWKDRFLSPLGWRVLRFTEQDIIERLDSCAARVQGEIHSLGGLRPVPPPLSHAQAR